MKLKTHEELKDVLPAKGWKWHVVGKVYGYLSSSGFKYFLAVDSMGQDILDENYGGEWVRVMLSDCPYIFVEECQEYEEVYLANEEEVKAANTEDRLAKICDHFGVDNQIKKLAEEAGELRQAAFEFGQGECSREDFLGEIADVMILCQQVCTRKGWSPKAIGDFIMFKVARTEERIKSGYYKEVVK